MLPKLFLVSLIFSTTCAIDSNGKAFHGETNYGRSSDCPGDGWTKSGAKCFLIVEQKVDIIEADHICKLKGGTLATIDNNEEKTFVEGLLKGKTAWIGLIQTIPGSKSYTWADRTGVRLDYLPWRKLDPNQYCGMKWGAYYWEEEPIGLEDGCCDHKHHVLCQIRIDGNANKMCGPSLIERMACDIEILVEKLEKMDQYMRQNDRNLASAPEAGF